ncbi:MAG: polysaccharide deacetylase family protein [Candidatus Dojkabacteria bacterium]|nr:polysaccharide deacetylase family protein [Candidatus Dojkabacteria bacterium]
MKKERKKSMRTFFVILILVVGFEIFIGIGLILFPDIIDSFANTFNLSTKIDTSQIEYTAPENIENINPLIANLEILPPDYDTLVKKIGVLTQHEKTRLLRYGQTLHSTDQPNLTDTYKYIYSNNLNVLIPQEYIDTYFISRISSIIQDIKDSTVIEKLLEQLNTRFPNFTITQSTEEIDISTYKDIPSSDILIQWYMFNNPKSSNEYTDYLQNILNRYTLTTKSVEDTEEDIDLTTYTGKIYFDTDMLKIYKMTFILSYLENVYSQTKINKEDITNSINELKDMNGKLAGYWNDTTQDMKSILEKISLYYGLNQEEGTIKYLLRSIQGDTIQTYIAPIYSSEDLEINDNNFNEPYDIKVSTQAKNSTRIPIFMYHQMGNPPNGSSKFVQGLYVTAEQFEKQLAYLVKNNYTTTNSLGLYNQLKKGGNPSQKTVMITFDDGTRGHYTVAYPLLKKYGLTGTFYIVTNRSSIIGTELKEMANSGMEIASHSATHPNLVNITDMEQLDYEIYNSKSMLTARTGKPVYGIAYPACVADTEVYSRVAGAGYLIGGSCGSSVDHYLSRRLSLHRVHAYGDMKTFKNLLSGQRWEYDN